jgi:hypothetical protein
MNLVFQQWRRCSQHSANPYQAEASPEIRRQFSSIIQPVAGQPDWLSSAPLPLAQLFFTSKSNTQQRQN